MRKLFGFALSASLAIGCGESAVNTSNTSSGPLTKQAVGSQGHLGHHHPDIRHGLHGQHRERVD